MVVFLFGILISVLLLLLSFAPFNFWFCAWFALIPFLYCLSLLKTYRSCFFFSWAMGFLFFISTVWWVGYVTILGNILLCFYLALYWGMIGCVYFHIRSWHVFNRIIFLSSFWIIIEICRSYLSSFAWMFLGHSQALNIWVIQIADIVGVSGISFLVVFVNVLLTEMVIYFFYTQRSLQEVLRRFKTILIVSMIMMVTILCYGYIQTQVLLKKDVVRVGVVQPNVLLEEAWSLPLRPEIISRHLRMSEALLKELPDVIIWPETALPHFYWEYPYLMQEIKDFIVMNHAPILLGAVTKEHDQYFNSALLFDLPLADEVARYDKRALVLFGEYIPFRQQFPFLEYFVPIDDFTAGGKQQLFMLKNKHFFSVLICFEDTLSSLAVEDVRKGAQFFVNITNDAWFKDSPGAQLHLHHALFRAVENRRSLVRATNTGMSCLVTPQGNIKDCIVDHQGKSAMISGQKTMEVPIETRKTFFTKFPQAFTFLCFLIIIFLYAKQKTL